MGVRTRQFAVLLWKNYLLQKREDLATVFQLGLPVVFVLICIPSRRIEIGSEAFHAFNFTYDPYEVERLCPPDQNCSRPAPQLPWKIYYTPVVPATDGLMATTKNLLNRGKHLFEVRGFDDENSMVEMMMTHSGHDSSSSHIVAGVVFAGMPPSGIGLPSHIRYKIRLQFTEDVRTLFPYGRRSQRSRHPPSTDEVYSKTGFLALQRNIDTALMHVLHPGIDTSSVRVELQRFPYPLSEAFAEQLRGTLPLVLLLSFICSVIDTTKDIVQEREAQLKEVMKIMGLNNWLHWLAWFVKTLLMLSIPVIAITIVLATSLYTSSSIILLFLLVYVIAIINFCFAVSVVFDKAEWAASGVGVLYVATFVFYYFLDHQPLWFRRLVALFFCNVSMAYGTRTISMYEEDGSGLHWGNLARLPANDTGETVTMLFVITALLFNALLHAVFTWYVEAVWPGEFGIPKQWDFPFSMSYWRDIISEMNAEQLDEAETTSITMSVVDSISRDASYIKEPSVGNPGDIVIPTTSISDMAYTVGNSLGPTEEIPVTDGASIAKTSGARNISANNNGLGSSPPEEKKAGDSLFKTGVGSSTVSNTIATGAATKTLHKTKPILFSQHRSTLSVPRSMVIGGQLVLNVESPMVSKSATAPQPTTAYFQFEHHINQARIEIKNLRKTFGDVHKHVAVEGMDFNMYDNQITVLLGHNGAGKTTTLRMLTGFYPPTSGTAIVNGYDIRTDISRVRRSLGICPQNTVLFNSLNVEEHVQFFARLSGKHIHITSSQIQTLLTALGLQSSSQLPVAALSEGKKRKLSMLMAFVSDARVLILDEPTAGLDVDTRRHMWSILKRMRKGRTILMSTHYMDEAEFLADRIAIMVDGSIQCCGSPSFLKKAFGAGYHLVLEISDAANVQTITDFVSSYVSKVTPNNDDNNRLHFSLPESNASSFKDMLATLQNNKDELGIVDYQMMAMTMEDVFIRVGQLADSKDVFISSIESPAGHQKVAFGFANTEAVSKSSSKLGDSDAADDVIRDIYHKHVNDDDLVVGGRDRNKGFSLFVQQSAATLLKRVLYCRRNWLPFAIQLVLPLGFIVLVSIATTMTTFAGRRATSAALPLSLDEYAESTTVLYSDCSQENKTIRSLSKLFVSFFGNSRHVLKHLSNGDLVKRVLLRKAADGYSHYRTQYIIAAEFRIETVNTTHSDNSSDMTNTDSPVSGSRVVVARALYNYDAFHSAGIALNVIDNVLLRHLGAKTYSIDTVNHPVDKVDDLLTKVPVMKETFTGLLVSVVMLFGMSFYTSTFVLFLIHERKSGSLRCQGFAAQGFWTFETKEIEVTQTSLFSSKIVVCTILHPIFALLSGLNIFCRNWSLGFFRDITEDSPCSQNNFNYSQNMCSMFIHQSNYLSFNDTGIGWVILLLAFEGVILLIILRWRGSRLLPLPWGKWLACLLPQEPILTLGRHLHLRNGPEDVDVEVERWRIECKMPDGEEDIVVLRNLSRYYGHQAGIDRVSLGVPAGQCFGLLGANGAGKTTTLRLIAGDLLASHGTVLIDGHDVRINVQLAYERLGYCPQADPLVDYLTGQETLFFFARLSGIPEKRIPPSANRLIRILQLTRVANQTVNTYSMGEKRRLSAGLVYITEPAIVLMDEPSVGMDPVARQRLGELITLFTKLGGTTILASHCMNQCEQLCQRLGILVNGRLRCLGSPSHLRNKYGQGYTVTVKLKRTKNNPDSDQLKSFLNNHLPMCKLTGESDEELQYHVTDKTITWPAVHIIMEDTRDKYDNILDYIISQSNLQHVFIGMARLQETRESSHMSLAITSMLDGV